MNLRTSTKAERYKCRQQGSVLSLFLTLPLLLDRLARGAFVSDSDEYDIATLDPESPYGSPYGGFSRAAAYRLASLPLKLPHVTDNLDEFESFSLHVKDISGRSFSCRSYHADELDPRNLDEGMFEPPIILDKYAVESTEAGLDEEEITKDTDDHNTDAAKSNKFDDEIFERLAQLTGICAQVHQGWWSYEWCFEGKMTQFHVVIEGLGSQEQYLKVEDVINLGAFKQRMVTSKNTEELKTTEQDYDRENVEVVQEFEGGDACPKTGKHRETTAHLKCCSSESAVMHTGIVLYMGEPFETNLVYLLDVVESQKQPCTYSVTVCTPLLCGDGDAGIEKQTHAPPDASDPRLDRNSIEELEKLSVSEILDMAFGASSKKCIQFGTGSWWVYELCPGKLIRQFHEVTLLSGTSTSTAAIDSEHILGKFVPSLRLPREDEWVNVVNATMRQLQSKSKTGSRPPLVHGGNGAYFFQEYTGGDVCDHAEVTESAIKAGEVGEGLIERSTTVKYGCGSKLEMMVKEDTTCHYVAYVSVPALCHHPLFRSPVAKKQVIKCLPDNPRAIG